MINIEAGAVFSPPISTLQYCARKRNHDELEIGICHRFECPLFLALEIKLLRLAPAAADTVLSLMMVSVLSSRSPFVGRREFDVG